MADKESSKEVPSITVAANPRNRRLETFADDREHASPEKGPPQTPSKLLSEHFWAIVGKGGTIIALLIGLATLVKLALPVGPDLIARCGIVDGPVPPPSLLYGKLRSTIEEPRSMSSVQYVLDEIPATSKWSPAEKEKAAKAIVAELSPTDLRDLDITDTLDQLVQCQIANEGNEPAREVVVDLPAAPSLVMMGKTSLPLTEDQKSIPLGSVRPGIVFDLSMWFRFPEWVEDRFRISHQSGGGKVTVFDMRWHFPGPVARFAFLVERTSWPKVAMGSLLVLGITALVLKRRSRRVPAIPRISPE